MVPESMPQKTSHQPIRMCVGCRQKFPKKELVRLVWQDGAIVIDEHQRLPGRGAYLCRKMECAQIAIRRKAFHRAFRKEIPARAYQQFQQLFQEKIR